MTPPHFPQDKHHSYVSCPVYIKQFTEEHTRGRPTSAPIVVHEKERKNTGV